MAEGDYPQPNGPQSQLGLAGDLSDAIYGLACHIDELSALLVLDALGELGYALVDMRGAGDNPAAMEWLGTLGIGNG
jgi:hypothetical protein